MIRTLGSKSCPQTYLEGTHLVAWEGDKHCPQCNSKKLETIPQDEVQRAWTGEGGDDPFGFWCPDCGTWLGYHPGEHLTWAGTVGETR